MGLGGVFRAIGRALEKADTAVAESRYARDYGADWRAKAEFLSRIARIRAQQEEQKLSESQARTSAFNQSQEELSRARALDRVKSIMGLEQDMAGSELAGGTDTAGLPGSTLPGPPDPGLFTESAPAEGNLGQDVPYTPAQIQQAARRKAVQAEEAKRLEAAVKADEQTRKRAKEDRQARLEEARLTKLTAPKERKEPKTRELKPDAFVTQAKTIAGSPNDYATREEYLSTIREIALRLKEDAAAQSDLPPEKLAEQGLFQMPGTEPPAQPQVLPPATALTPGASAALPGPDIPPDYPVKLGGQQMTWAEVPEHIKALIRPKIQAALAAGR